MQGWLERLLGRTSAAPTNAASPQPVVAPSRTFNEASSSAAAPLVGMALRRPLLDAGGSIAGFEFMPPPLLARRLAAGGDESGASAHLLALLAGIRTAQLGAPARIALLGLRASLLSRPAVRAALPAGTWLALPNEEFTAELASDLLTSQVIVGVEQVPRRGAGFVRIDAAALGDLAGLGAAISACRAAAATARIVVTGLASTEEIEAALTAGADLAGGHHDVMKGSPAAVPLPAAMVAVARLMQQLQSDSDVTVLANTLRADVALSYALLRHANSPLLGLRRQVDSVEHAVMLLGRAALYRWLCLRLLAAAPPRRAARAFMEVALTRALLAEALAGRAGLEPGRAFTTGLLSLLDVMVPMPMAAAVAPLNLAADMQTALVDRQGPLATPIRLAACLERGDAAGAAVLAGPLGGLEAVVAAHDEAWSNAAALLAANA